MFKLKTCIHSKLQLRPTDTEHIRAVKTDYINAAHSALKNNLLLNQTLFPTDNIDSNIIPIFGETLSVFEYMGICIINTMTDKTILFTYCKETENLDIRVCPSFQKALSEFYNISIEEVEKMNFETIKVTN